VICPSVLGMDASKTPLHNEANEAFKQGEYLRAIALYTLFLEKVE